MATAGGSNSVSLAVSALPGLFGGCNSILELAISDVRSLVRTRLLNTTNFQCLDKKGTFSSKKKKIRPELEWSWIIDARFVLKRN